MKRKKWIMFSMIMLVLLSFGCSQESSSAVKTITLDAETEIPLETCAERGLGDKIVILESEYCGHCKIAAPILKKIGQEKGLDFEFLDVSKKEGRTVMENYGVNVKYTPTLIAGCAVYIGSKSKEEYLHIIDKFVETR